MTACGGHLRYLFPLLAILAVAGCAAHQPALPWPLDLACQPGFPSNSAASGLLEVAVDDASSSYFVGIDTRPSGTELQIVSLQGLPLYRLNCTGGRAAAKSLATVDSPLSGPSLVAYLLAMYGDTRTIPEAPAGWRTDKRSASDFAWLGTGGRELSVERSGDLPWYRSLTLRDPGENTTLTLTIREIRDVVPE